MSIRLVKIKNNNGHDDAIRGEAIEF